MSSRIWKILKHTVIAVLSLAVLFLVLNLFLTGRLERYLKRELIERTANATDGFYRLSFDKLSISFFKGELRLEGVSLEPDSKVFEHWAALDSLPDTYVSTRIEVIDFKGIWYGDGITGNSISIPLRSARRRSVYTALPDQTR